MTTAVLFFVAFGLLIARTSRETARRQAIVQANAESEKKLAEARRAILKSDFAAAERLVGEADAIPNSTNQEKGRAIAADASARRAVAEADKSITAGQLDAAKALLKRAVASGAGKEPPADVAELLEQLVTATSPEHATELAKTLSDAELVACTDKGELPVGKRLANPTLNARFVAECQAAIGTILATRAAERIEKDKAERAERRRADIGRQFIAIEPPGGTYRMAVSGNGRFIASIDAEGNRIVVQSTDEGKVIAQLTPPAKRRFDGMFSTCCMSSDGGAVAAVVSEEEGQAFGVPFVVVWDVVTTSITGLYSGVKEVGGFTDYLNLVCLTRDHVVAAATSRKAAEEKSLVRVWDRDKSTLVRSFEGHRKPVKAIDVHSESGLVATGGEDRVVIVWDAETGREIAVFDDHESEVEAVAFSPDGTQVISGGFECSVRLWDVASRKLQAKWQLGLHDSQEEAKMRMAEAERRLQSQLDSLSGRSRITVSPVAAWPYPRVSNVAFSSDGARVVVGLQAPLPQAVTHKTNPVLIDVAAREIVLLPAAFQAEPLGAVKAYFVRDGDAVMFTKVLRERVRGEVKLRTVLSINGIP
jgi:hypothetical protein